MISNTVITWTISLTIVLIVWPSSMNADKNAASLSFNNNQENKPATVEPFAKVNTLQAKESEIYRKQAHLIASGFSKILWDYIQQNYHNNSNIDSLDNCLQSYHAIFRLIELGNESVPRMLSASGRIPSNFFDGTYVDFGSFEQCLQIDTMESPYKDNLKFGGQYCLASLEPNLIVNYEDESQSSKLDEKYTGNHKVINLYPHMFDRQFNLSIMIGYCVPSTCSSEQIQDLITKALEPYSWSFVQNVSCQKDKSFSTRLDEAPKSQKISLAIIEKKLLTQKTMIQVDYFPNLSNRALVCTLIITVLMATIADYSLPWLKSSPPKFLQCFSMRKSMRVLLRKPDSERMLLLDILRVSTFIAQFIMHSSTWHTIIRAAYLTDRMNLSSQSMRYWLVQPFLNTWTVEGLVILGGTSSCMGLWGKTTEKSSIFMYIPLILKKIRNTLPPLITIICLEIALPLFGSGPIYESMTGYMSNMCSNTFIYSICHVANFLHPFSRCAVQTWTLSVEVQLFIMVCFVIYVYKKIPRLGLVINLIFLSFGTWSLFHIFYTNDIPPQVTIMPLKAEKIFLYFEKYYLTTQAHVWSYFFALLLTKLIWDKIDEKMSKGTFKKYFNILLVILITQMFSTGLWNVLELNISRFWMAVYVLVYQYIGATFWAAIFITQGPEFRRVYAPKKIKALNGQKVDKNLNLIDSSVNAVEKHQRELNNHQNNNDTNLIPKIKIHKNKASLIVSRKLIEHILGVSLRILRGTYFIHVTFLTWYCAQRKDILSHGIFDLVTRTHGLTVLCIVSGFVFYLFVGGPTESLLHYFDKKPRQKVHQS